MKLSNKMCALQNRTPKNLLDTQVFNELTFRSIIEGKDAAGILDTRKR